MWHKAGVGHQALVEVKQGVRRYRVARPDFADRAVHGTDVPEDLGCGQVDDPFTELPRCLCPEELARANLEALDA